MNDTTRKYPRTMAEAFPDVRASAGSVYKKPSKLRMAISYVLFIVISYFLAHQAAIVIAKAQAEAEALQEERKQSDIEKLSREALIEKCGGPEATCIKRNGSYESITKRGFKQEVK